MEEILSRFADESLVYVQPTRWALSTLERKSAESIKLFFTIVHNTSCKFNYIALHTPLPNTKWFNTKLFVFFCEQKLSLFSSWLARQRGKKLRKSFWWVLLTSHTADISTWAMTRSTRSVDEANPSTRIEQQWQAKANKSIGIVHFQSKTRWRPK